MQLPPTILSIESASKKLGKKLQSVTSTKAPAAVEKPKASVSSKVVPQSDEATKEPPTSDSEATLGSEADEGELSVPEEKIVSSAKERKNQKRVRRPRSLRPPRSLETTLFDRLEKMYGPGIKRMLDVQYRCVIAQ